ncbi:trypsin-like peptidase domain-containing protein [Anaerocolumna xylanovorans]|uniref:Ig-like domain (Group 2) n=1 Tax=Anaerocolumna xylanovorans DSM 12503 TaxID=1121345 RepID=A0A1M7YE37_9FIRM|nr:trypsin-like peptidase domain-containing protein [Anaerocolumna xylanovorans]SHO50910.1 Ig-like domain (group 2) [Anaerocolumna xylanovorans DSM 12503]
MKQIKKAALALITAATLALSPVAIPIVPAVSYATAATVKLNTTKATVYTGKTVALKITGTSSKVSWTSSSPKIASVSGKGVVTGIKAGSATITATVNKKKYTCKITVKNKVSRLSSNISAITLNQESYVTITLKNSTKEDTVLYTIADNGIVSCRWGEWAEKEDNLKLYLLPKKKGSTTITVKTKTGTDKATIKVTVGTDARSVAPETSKIAEKCSPSVVQITTDIGLGTGFFIEKGVIATNYHVIKDATSIAVALNNGKEYKIDTILGYDEDLDLALLSLPGVGTPLTISKFAPKTGDTAYAIGSPLGLGNTFSKGIISNASRISDNVEYIQTDTALSSGNSGGPLLNIYGEVIGINTMQYSEGQNLNFALNITQVYSISTLEPIPVSSSNNNENTDTDYSKITIKEDTAKSGNISTAQDVPAGYYITGSVDPSANPGVNPTGLDSYRITLDKYSRISVLAATATSYSSDLSGLHLSIADSNNKPILYEYTDDDDDGFLNVFADLPAGTYYIQVSAVEGKVYAPLPYFIYYNVY